MVAQVVSNLPSSSDPRLIVGTDGFSDAGVFQVADNLQIVQSVDFFAPLTDDPYRFGQIAAANSLSDVFAMGAAPITTLNIVCFPDDKLDLEILSEILRGGTEKVHEAGAVNVGGHSIRDQEIKFGMSVTGLITPDQLITNQGAQPGDVLVLTKALGTGYLTTAMKAQRCQEDHATAALDSMAHLNQAASLAAQSVGVHAITDITGFGFAVHAGELAQASDVTLVIDVTQLPLLPGAHEYYSKGLVTRANKTNREFCESHLNFHVDKSVEFSDILFDPQTSGGLLVSLPENRLDAYLQQARERGAMAATPIGSVVERESSWLRV